MNKLVLAALLVCACAAFAAPAAADVTIKITTSGAMGTSSSVMYIKGAKMRQETGMSGQQLSTIIDATAKQMIVLDPNTKQATVYDLGKLAEEMQKTARPQDAKVSLTPTGETKQLLERTCTGYTLALSFTASLPAAMPGQPSPSGPVQVNIGGPVWLAKDAPGTADFTAFFKAASESGLFFGSPGPGGAQNPLARGMSLMYQAYANANGIPYEQQINVDLVGVPMQPPPVTMTVTGVTTDPIPDDMFTVPAGYVKKTQ
jgi:hypothetical protein